MDLLGAGFLEDGGATQVYKSSKAKGLNNVLTHETTEADDLDYWVLPIHDAVTQSGSDNITSQDPTRVITKIEDSHEYRGPQKAKKFIH